ncbi:hypothetical protein [Mesorhizobium sp.]|uniref:hypothetical protein n=1 Tax=Mesorhizobium sp. TaxID=1871066 RepID=UPI0025CDC8EF|nr:hypothetical protein [Mesorhizobium sp.]
MLLVGGLALIAFLTRNLWAVVVALGLMAAGFAYVQIDKAAYDRAAAEQLAEKLKAKDEQIRQRDALIEAARQRINVLNAANELDAMQALTDADEISKLKAQINETPADATIALKRAATGRLRAFRRAAAGRAAAAASGAAAGPGRH